MRKRFRITKSMILGLLIISAFFAAIAGVMVFLAGHGILLALLTYSLSGSVILLLLAMWVYVRSSCEDRRGHKEVDQST